MTDSARSALKDHLVDDKNKLVMVELLYKDLGRMDYLASLVLQEKLVELKQRGSRHDILLFVEHCHVYTLGRAGKTANVIAPQEVPVYQTSRGGDVTYHGPGQLVAYPIIDLRSKLRKNVHRYLRNLETATIRTLEDFGLEAERKPPYTGIWIGDKKIAAIGVAVRRCITFHGLALNVNTDLSYFNRIVPCGLTWANVTSMAKEVGEEVDRCKVRESFRHHFAEIFGYLVAKESDDAGLPFQLETRNSELETAR